MRRTLLLLTIVAGIALVAWSGWHNWHERELRSQLIEQTTKMQSANASDDEASAISPLKGKAAPEFSLDDLSGKKVTLDDFKGRPLLINFWGTYCGPCKIEMPWIEELSKKYAANGFKVVGITYDAEVGKEIIARDTQRLGVTYPILLSDAKSEKDYLSGTEVLPISFYVDRTGKIIEVAAGAGSKDDIEALVKETIAAGGN
jgi:thiol-disulfide isomerase/thioredoxin